MTHVPCPIVHFPFWFLNGVLNMAITCPPHPGYKWWQTHCILLFFIGRRIYLHGYKAEMANTAFLNCCCYVMAWHHLPLSPKLIELGTASAVTLMLSNQKNGTQTHVVHQQATGTGGCPIKALVWKTPTFCSMEHHCPCCCLSLLRPHHSNMCLQCTLMLFSNTLSPSLALNIKAFASSKLALTQYALAMLWKFT